MHGERQFSDLFLKFLLARSMRSQADLIDQLVSSSEKRLARIFLLMAEFGEPGTQPETLIPAISQETLAEMVGTTRSRVNFFMNRFRKLGFIEYNGRIRVHRPLLKVVLHDRECPTITWLSLASPMLRGIGPSPQRLDILVKKMTSNAIGLSSSSLEDALGVQRPILDPLAPITDGALSTPMITPPERLQAPLRS
jgi:hypothetical protein